MKTGLLRQRLFRARPNSFDVASTLHADFLHNFISPQTCDSENRENET